MNIDEFDVTQHCSIFCQRDLDQRNLNMSDFDRFSQFKNLFPDY